jgi:hypothetical protein
MNNDVVGNNQVSSSMSELFAPAHPVNLSLYYY